MASDVVAEPAGADADGGDLVELEAVGILAGDAVRALVGGLALVLGQAQVRAPQIIIFFHSCAVIFAIKLFLVGSFLLENCTVKSHHARRALFPVLRVARPVAAGHVGGVHAFQAEDLVNCHIQS